MNEEERQAALLAFDTANEKSKSAVVSPDTDSPSEAARESISQDLAVDLFDRANAKAQGQGTYDTRVERNVDVSKYSKYMDGVSAFQDIDKVRAANQGLGEQLFRFGWKTPVNAVLGLVENIGVLADLDSWGATVTGNSADFSNWLTDIARSGKDAVNDSSEIYRDNPEKVWDLFDLSFYLNHGSQLIESIAAFYFVGAGVGQVLSRGAAGLAKAINAGTTASRGLAAGAQVGTSFTLAWTEGAIEAADVHQRLMSDNLAKGMSREEANRLAGLGAVQTARINLFNTLLNLTAVAPIMRGMPAMKAMRTSPLARLGNESRAMWMKRVAQETGNKSIFEKLRPMLFEAGQEGAEEVWNEVASAEGYFRGQQLNGSAEDVGFSDRLAAVLSKPETGLAFALGAAGGIGQTALVEYAPLPTRKRNEDGLLTTVYQSNHTKKAAAEKVLFTKTRDDMVARSQQILQNQERLQKAAENIDANDPATIRAYEKAQNELFELAAIDNIKRGIEEQMIGQYEEIANLQIDEAEAKGFVIDPLSENNYRTLATQKIAEIKELTKMWEEADAKYSFNDEERLSGLPGFVFAIQARHYGLTKGLDLAQKQVERERNQTLDELNRYGVDPVLGDLTARQLALRGKLETKTQEDVMAEIKEELKTPGGRERIRNLYGTDVVSSIEKSVNREFKDRMALVAKESKQIEADKRAYEEAEGLKEGEANGHIDYLVAERHTSFNNLVRAANIANQIRQEFVHSASALNNITSGKGRSDYTKSFDAEVAKIIQKQTDQVVADLDNATSEEEVSEIVKGLTNPQTEKAAAKKKAQIANDAVYTGSNIVLPDGVDEKTLLAPEGPGEDFEPELLGSEYYGEDPVTDYPVEEGHYMPEEMRQKAFDHLMSLTDPDKAQEVYDFVTERWDMNIYFVRPILAHIAKLREQIAAGEEPQPGGRRSIAKADEQKATDPEVPPGNSADTRQQYSSKAGALMLDEDRNLVDSSGQVVMSGRLIVPAASAIAYRSRDFITVKNTDEDGTEFYSKVTSSMERTEGLAPEIESLDYIVPGTQIVLTVDDTFSGSVYGPTGDVIEDQTYDKIVAMYEGNEETPPWAMVPIKIEAMIDGKSKVIGYIHDMRWIKDNVNGTPRNVAHYVDGDNNWGRQQAQLTKIRKALWERRRVTTQVDSRGTSNVNRNYKTDELGKVVMKDGKPQPKWEPVSTLIPDKDIKFYVIRGGLYHTDHNTSLDEETLLNTQDASDPHLDGQTGVMIPLSRSSNGELQYLAMPVWLPTMTEAQANALWKTIEGFHVNEQIGSQIAKQIGKAFSYETNSRTLTELVSQYQYSSHFTPETFRNTNVKPSRVYFHIGDDSGHVQIARHGDAVIYTTDSAKKAVKGYRYMFEKNGAGEFVHQAEVVGLLRQRQLQVELSPMNNPAFPIQEISFEGDVPTITKRPYKDFLRDHLLTDVDGTKTVTHADGRTEYVYGQQAVITFDTSFTGSRPITETKKTASTDPMDDLLGETAEESATAIVEGDVNPALIRGARVDPNDEVVMSEESGTVDAQESDQTFSASDFNPDDFDMLGPSKILGGDMSIAASSRSQEANDALLNQAIEDGRITLTCKIGP